MDKLKENSYQIDHQVYSDGEEINAIINQKVKLNPKIHFEISVTRPVLDSMVQTVCIIVFNNAIHEIDNYPSEKKRTSLTIRSVPEFLIIECKNPNSRFSFIIRHSIIEIENNCKKPSASI